MIALGIKEKLGIPWLADFRDPWTNIDFYNKLMLTKRSDKMHRKMEQEVLSHADTIVTVSYHWAKDFEKICKKPVEVVTNGFDPEDFISLKYKKGETFELVHLGSMNKDRNPVNLWKALSEICQEDDRFKRKLKITFIGQTDYSVFESIKENKLDDQIEKIDYLPHQQAMELAANATVLLLPLNNTPNVDGIIPGKLFEYLALQRPILCVGPEEGDSAKIIQECHAGVTVDFSNRELLKLSLKGYYDLFNSKSGVPQVKTSNLENYSRNKLTQRIVNFLD
jgi:glycosyltransferase involved in cell wall biosynthesis